MERIGFAMRLLPGAGGRVPRAGTPPSGRRCSPRSGRPARANYSIFLHGEDLFGYLEVEDFAAFQDVDGGEPGQRPLAGRDGAR